MAKYTIEIPDLMNFHDWEGYNFQITDSRGTAVAFRGTPKKIHPQPQPPYPRQTVLQELWDPGFIKDFEEYESDLSLTDCWFVNKEQNDLIGFLKRGSNFQRAKTHLIFSPTKELAEEIVQIRSGKWLPKKGDRLYCSNHSDVDEIATFNFEYSATCIYFPSKKQRDAFIEKQKKNVCSVCGWTKALPITCTNPYCKTQPYPFSNGDKIIEKNKPKEESYCPHGFYPHVHSMQCPYCKPKEEKKSVYNPQLMEDLMTLTVPDFFEKKLRENNYEMIKEFSIWGYKFRLVK